LSMPVPCSMLLFSVLILAAILNAGYEITIFQLQSCFHLPSNNLGVNYGRFT
jgi:hypothetical protein